MLNEPGPQISSQPRSLAVGFLKEKEKKEEGEREGGVNVPARLLAAFKGRGETSQGGGWGRGDTRKFKSTSGSPLPGRQLSRSTGSSSFPWAQGRGGSAGWLGRWRTSGRTGGTLEVLHP